MVDVDYPQLYIDTHVKIIFHSRPQPVSVKRTDVKIIGGMSTDNAEMDMSRFNYSQPSYGMPPSMPTQAPWAPSYSQQPIYNNEETTAETVVVRQPWCVVGARVRCNSGLTGVITKCNQNRCTVGDVWLE